MADFPDTSSDAKPQTNAASPAPSIDEEDEGSASLVSEFFWFIRENKKWWLIPLLIAFAGLLLLIFLGSNPATAPFIYPLF